ncbi:alpha/beta hydrolase [Virgibacillus sp. YIM 98842]|uniref:alpha/beta fold hydrolase n=1 Tax=Virgibacillus sp. YIM 98842 TaxID=2663533 RepID=UPI0013DA3EB8|nr:alpha/beta hydrolase [Virgibacillus sp. YIM 98842]
MYVTLNGCKIYYEVHGNEEGETIFFIHGGPGMSDCRGDVKAFSDLGDTYRLVFLDNRGSGRSETVPPYTHEQWISDIDALREYLGIEEVHMLGGSYGGFLTLEYVLRYPERVKSIILRDTAPNNKNNHLSIDKAMKSNLPGINKEMLDRLFGGEVRSNEEFREMTKAILPLYTVEWDEKAAEEKLNNTYFRYETHNYAFKVNKKQYDVSDRLNQITCPVLITVGIHDWVTPVEYSDEMAVKIPNNTYIKFENSGHSPHVEENEKYLKLVREFLAG